MSGGPLALIAIYLTGLGLNLTPCVYPLLSVTVSLFSAASSESRANAFGKAVVYVAGMTTMYTALGMAAALSGNLFGTVLQSRWALLFISALLFALALGLFGVYTFQLPGQTPVREETLIIVL